MPVHHLEGIRDGNHQNRSPLERFVGAWRRESLYLTFVFSCSEFSQLYCHGLASDPRHPSTPETGKGSLTGAEKSLDPASQVHFLHYLTHLGQGDTHYVKQKLSPEVKGRRNGWTGGSGQQKRNEEHSAHHRSFIQRFEY